MPIWFLENPERLILERKEIEQLQLNEKWLSGVEWKISGNNLAVRVEMEAHGHFYEMEMEYPSIFPFAPPSVKPIDENKWWTEHQYTSGTLCLEWGPDNWHSSVSGAKMLASAYRLINTENPKGSKKSNEHSFVPSRHSLTMGQELRNEKIRLYLNQSLLEIISSIGAADYLEMDFQFIFESKAAVLHITNIYHKSKLVWENQYLPEELKGKLLGKAQAFLSNSLPEENEALVSTVELKHLLLKNGIVEDYIIQDNQCDWLYLLTDGEDNIIAFLNFEGEDKLYKVTTVMENEKIDRRHSDFYELKDKKVGIVGLGSLGSKIANSLTRTGVGSFYLIDEDVFLSGNIQRHTLDWKSVGVHKVNGIKNQLKLISTSINVEVSFLNLTGQESTSAFNAVTSRLGTCDIIIDATANNKVFNLLAAVCKGYNRPMFWGEVFAGGIGGFIARSRPNLDPSPQTMRKAFFETTQNVPAISQVGTRPYELEVDPDEVWIATDMDVGIIANHLSRLITDTLKNGKSDYPYSMYLIGLKKAWIFDEPFATFPIKTEHLNEELPKEDNHHDIKEVIDFIMPLLDGKKDD
jgi:ubiquitin-protein ligase